MSVTADPDRDRVLVVEDDPHVRDAVERALRFEGYDVYTAVDGNDGLLKVESIEPQAIVLDPTRRQAWRGDRELDLTKTEFDLLELLMFNAGVVVAREVIYERIWGYDFETSSKSLDVYIGYLRRKTEAGGERRLINTVRGVGYSIRA